MEYLKLLRLDEPIARFPLGQLTPVVVGRDESCDIVLYDPSVSRIHARLMRSEGSLRLEDLKSSGGVYCNGVRIQGSTELTVGDRLTIGAFTLEIGDIPAEDGFDQRDSETIIILRCPNPDCFKIVRRIHIFCPYCGQKLS